MDVHPTKNVSIGIDPYPCIDHQPATIRGMILEVLGCVWFAGSICSMGQQSSHRFPSSKKWCHHHSCSWVKTHHYHFIFGFSIINQPAIGETPISGNPQKSETRDIAHLSEVASASGTLGPKGRPKGKMESFQWLPGSVAPRCATLCNSN